MRHRHPLKSARGPLLVGILAALTLTLPSPALASPQDARNQPTSPSPGEEQPGQELPPELLSVPGAGQQCVDTALARNADNWVCNGALLITPERQEVLPVVPRPDLEPPAPAPDPQRLQSDDYDAWCEPDSHSPCIREVGEFVSEAKNNLVYGNEDGVVGTFDWIIRLNLNGRSARFTTTTIHDEGPSLDFIRSDVHCREVVPGPLPDSSCGINYMGSPFTVANQSRFTYGPAQGSNIVDAGTYFAEGRMQFHPAGIDYVYSIPSSAIYAGPQSERFICPTENRNCYFNR